MIFELSKTELEKCKKLLKVKEFNIEAAEFYNDYLTNNFREISTAKSEAEWFEKFNKLEQVNNKVIANCKMNKISKLNTNTFLNDSYYKKIGQIKASEGDWKFSTYSYAPYEGFVSDELVIDQETFAEHTPISYFENEFPFFAVTQKDEIWMSIIPHEINTMKKPIENAHGDVLVLGLGLGYYVFNIASKKNVTSITVIENDRKIINLFIKYLLPKFPNQDKIEIVFGDAISFVKDSPRKYDYVFADIWHNVGDGEILYLKLKAKEKYRLGIKFDYWIETSILAMLRRQTLTIFEEWLEGFTEDDYRQSRNENDTIINKIYFHHKNTQIKNFNDLHQILTDDSLKLMASKLFWNFKDLDTNLNE